LNTTGRTRPLCPPPKAPAVIKPINTTEIQAVVKIANQFKVPIYPISKGKNWGYGAACPVEEGNVIVDLSGMNRIIEVNTEQAYCVVEPGVTQQDLYDYLTKNKIPLVMDVTGAPPEASLIGNILERGIGWGPYFDHFASSCGMEIVLANGDILKTGFGHFDQAKCTYLYRYGIGPFLDGLFTQSNFGIVTQMGIWLAPKPKRALGFRIQIKDSKNLCSAIDDLHTLALEGIFQGNVHIFNSKRGQALGESENLTEGISDWEIIGAFYGETSMIRVKSKILKQKWGKDASAISFFNNWRINLLKNLPAFITKLITGIDKNKAIPMLDFLVDALNGAPSYFPISGMYRIKNERLTDLKTADPLKDGCGFIWIAPVIPFDGKSAKSFIEDINSIFERHQFDFQATFHTITERALYCVISIVFDKNNAEESGRAHRCCEEIWEENKGLGYFSYRTGIYFMNKLISTDDPFWKTVGLIKKALDPNEILAPGRYSS
jgi:4-cresol dehydrogenase (hydroxylating)